MVPGRQRRDDYAVRPRVGRGIGDHHEECAAPCAYRVRDLPEEREQVGGPFVDAVVAEFDFGGDPAAISIHHRICTQINREIVLRQA